MASGNDWWYDFSEAQTLEDIWLDYTKIKLDRTIWESGKAVYIFTYDGKYKEEFTVNNFTVENAEEYDEWVYNELEKLIIKKIFIDVKVNKAKLYKKYKIFGKKDE